MYPFKKGNILKLFSYKEVKFWIFFQKKKSIQKFIYKRDILKFSHVNKLDIFPKKIGIHSKNIILRNQIF